MKADVYDRLADHYRGLGQPPQQERLEDLLEEIFTPLEAEVLLALPNDLIPLQTVALDDLIEKVGVARQEVVDILESLSRRGLVFSGTTMQGETGYALLQKGFGFSQTFFWKGEKSPFAKKMAELLGRRRERKSPDKTPEIKQTLPNQFIPVDRAIESQMQGVYPFTMLEQVVQQAKVIAVAHCPCRMRAQLLGRGCDHPLEVCLKFDDLAEYLIEREIARPISKEEALEIISKAEEDGLVHFVDNALGDVKHNCNCCGCCCWALGPIKRREVPRDVIMATYFVRQTDEQCCIGCGDCLEVCPIDALSLDNGLAAVDEEWCIGCGLCVTKCPKGAAKLKIRSDRVPPQNFRTLHETILKEKGFSQSF